MTIFPISGELKDPLGTAVPGIIFYAGNFVQGPITCINAAIVQTPTLDYAKSLLDRVRYLRRTYTAPFGPNAVIPSVEAFKDAEAFIRKLPLHRTGLPTINVASDGEVNFDWSTNAIQIDLGFFGNGTYSYYARGGNYGEISGDGIAVETEVPKELVRIAAVGS
jgi:hypothetical protein